MLALTVWQPWASLIMVGAKPYEFRNKSYLDYFGHPKPGDRIVIHAGARPVRYNEVVDLLLKLKGDLENNTGLKPEIARDLLMRLHAAPKRQQLLPLGAGLGTAVIAKPRNAGAIFGRIVEDSDRGEFNWAWPLTDIEPFAAPIPTRGLQGFWTWPHKETRVA